VLLGADRPRSPPDADFRAEALRVFEEGFGEIIAGYAVGESWIIVNRSRERDLPADSLFLQHQRPEQRAPRINGGGQPGWPSADNNHVVICCHILTPIVFRSSGRSNSRRSTARLHDDQLPDPR